jgi:hypothetical protein
MASELEEMVRFPALGFLVKAQKNKEKRQPVGLPLGKCRDCCLTNRI